MKQLPPILEKERTWLYVRLLANGLCQALAVVAILFLVRYVFDSMVPRHGPIDITRILWLGLGLAAVGLVQGWLVLHSRIDSSRLGQKYSHDLRLLMFDHLTSLSPRSLQDRSEGAIMLRFTGDLTSIRRWISRGMVRSTVAGLTMGLALGVLAWLNWLLALAVALFLVLGLTTGFQPSRLIRNTVKELRRVRSYLMANIGEQISAAATVQVYGQEAKERERFARRSERMMNSAVAQARAGGKLRALARSASTAARAVILVAGAAEVSYEHTTLGTVAAALTVASLLSARMRTLGKAYIYYQKARVARGRIARFLEIPTLVSVPADGPELSPGPGRLEFDNVTFENAVRDFTAVAEGASTIALVGPNGAGKSTLLSLVARLIDPEKGRIHLDGQDITKFNLRSLRRAVSMAGADLPLLRGSIAHNLHYRCPEAAPEEFLQVRNICGLDSVLAELPDGERTHVLEAGRNLSLGQRQRVGLARAILGHPSVLLLDEVDANLDAGASAALDKALDQFPGTIIMVTHQAERIARADTVWYMDKGRLVRVERRQKHGNPV
jgi:ATP-binding cassette subfamily B protein